jgi:uncharacterized SAM-binding protein YcdF (DUF218 family)
MRNYVWTLLTASLVLVFGIVLLDKTGQYLVMDHPTKADVIVVLAGDRNDRRFFRGLELLRSGYAPRMLVDANSDMIFFGRTPAVLEDQLIRSLELNVDQVQVCPTQGDSTNEETRYVAQCLNNNQISSVLLVTSDFHTRRAISIFKRRLPKYRWSIAASRDDSVFSPNWWQRREWAKTAFMEWTKLIWWEAVDRWNH